MMHRNEVALVFSLMLILGAISFHFPSVDGAPSVPFRVEQVVWGTSTGNPIEVEPGDTNAPLTADVRNLSNETLRGVYGTLQLQGDPITDYITGGSNATAAGAPLQAGDIFNQTGEILPAGSFSLTFRLSIARNAVPGYYSYSLLIEYLVKWVNSTWLQGEPETVLVTVLLPNRSPTIDSFSPSAAALSVNVGDSLNFTSKCSDADNDTITYEWKIDGIVVSNSTGYTYTPTEKDVGSHTLVLTISDGRLTDSQTWTITATTVPISHVLVSSDYLTAGFDNLLDITLQNNLWKGTVQVRLAVNAPLIIRGNQSWVFESVGPSKNLSINPRIYAPASAIGQTFTNTLTINYNDERGQAYADTYNVGLIIQGYATLVIYDLVVNPQPVSSGSEITITATALNTGNVVASFANVSIQSDSHLDLLRESSTYVGDIEQNSPVPFTVVASVKSGVQNGTYPVVISLSYQDDQYRQHVLNVTGNVIVATGSKSQSDQNGMTGIFWFLSNGGWTILVVVAAGIALLILYVRHLSKDKPVSGPS